ncbi:chloride channel protein [Streptomyces sp. MUM 203J]|uniref:chloride channel protein n=1 Tax=Streptomyces sp. MUM 203J TaxID=2791990 RepID=UPI001F0429AF|nr:chloride channel protein [Streptomyces sp. MUM 203J]MCH0538896.1 chloride channel protein [Streptomyces sp. MUM 203J]
MRPAEPPDRRDTAPSAPEPSGTTPGTAPGEAALHQTLLSRGYRRLLFLSALLGVPIALACFFFLSLQHWLQREVWEDLPEALGMDRAPWWWGLPMLVLAGLILAPIVTRVPGGGGHLPVNGLGGGTPIGPRELPGVVLAALATLPLGVVLGPEAPLMAVGSGLALLSLRAAREPPPPEATAVVATAGSTAAISTILGGPVVASVLIAEAAGLAGPRLVMLLLPCLTASAAGALVFTGFGAWTGLPVGALSLPTVPPDASPDAGDFLWGIPAAMLIAIVVAAAHRLGERTARWTARPERRAARTVACASAVGLCVTAYALLTGRSPEEAALSGQATLAELAAHPHAWSVAALLALVACKALAWGISLGSLRGGPIFPAVLVGAALGVACAGLPGLGVTPGLSLGIAAAAAAVTGLPLTSAVLATLLMGGDAPHQTPLIVLASVTATVTARLLARDRAGDARP